MKFIRLLNDKDRPYDSYFDFNRLIELSGFESVDLESVDLDSQETYIGSPLNGNLLKVATKPRRCKIIGWQLERLREMEWRHEDFAPKCFDEVWTSDRWQAAQSPGVRYVPVGGHPDLVNRLNRQKVYDFAAFFAPSGHRYFVEGELGMRNYRIGPNAWNPEREEVLAKSWMGLCVHRIGDDYVLESLRAILFAMAKLPIVFEYCYDIYPFAGYGMDEIESARTDKRETVERNYKLLTEELTFRKCVEAAL